MKRDGEIDSQIDSEDEREMIQEVNKANPA
jgi:hypothetical protein